MLDKLNKKIGDFQDKMNYCQDMIDNIGCDDWVMYGHIGARDTYTYCIRELKKIIDEHEGDT